MNTSVQNVYIWVLSEICQYESENVWIWSRLEWTHNASVAEASASAPKGALDLGCHTELSHIETRELVIYTPQSVSDNQLLLRIDIIEQRSSLQLRAISNDDPISEKLENYTHCEKDGLEVKRRSERSFPNPLDFWNLSGFCFNFNLILILLPLISTWKLAWNICESVYLKKFPNFLFIWAVCFL